MLKRLQKPVLLGLPERNLQTIDLLSSLKDFRSAFLKRREMGVKWYECHFKYGGRSRFLFVQVVWIRQKTEDSSTSLLEGNGVHQLPGR